MPDRAAIEEWARHFAEHEPKWQAEDNWIQIREGGQRYFVISELDAGRLEALRELVLHLTEPSA